MEQLREGELSAGTLIERLGLEQANASQHFSVLRAKRVLVNRKAGNQVFYSVRDPLIIDVLDLMSEILLRTTFRGSDDAGRNESQSVIS